MLGLRCLRFSLPIHSANIPHCAFVVLPGTRCYTSAPARWLASTRFLAEAGATSPKFRIRRIDPRENKCSEPAGEKTGNKLSQKSTYLEDFEQRVAGGTATIEDASKCLIGLRAEVERVPFDGKRQACIDRHAGGRVLSWLLKERDGLPQEIYKDRDFCSTLMWFAIGEDLEEIIWDWIKIELNQGHDSLVMHLLGSLGEL